MDYFYNQKKAKINFFLEAIKRAKLGIWFSEEIMSYALDTCIMKLKTELQNDSL